MGGAREGEDGQEGEGQLQRHQHVQQVVQFGHIVDAREDGHEDGGHDGDGACQQHPLPALPGQVEETLSGGNTLQFTSVP